LKINGTCTFTTWKIIPECKFATSGIKNKKTIPLENYVVEVYDKSWQPQPIHVCKGVGLGQVVRKVRQHTDDHEFESQQWQ
jgi:hypothetical protein